MTAKYCMTQDVCDNSGFSSCLLGLVRLILAVLEQKNLSVLWLENKTNFVFLSPNEFLKWPNMEKACLPAHVPAIVPTPCLCANLPAYVPIFLPRYLPSYLCASLCSCLCTCLQAFLSPHEFFKWPNMGKACLPAYVSAYVSAYVPACLPAYVPAYVSACICAYLYACQPIFSLFIPYSFLYIQNMSKNWIA